MAKTISIVLGIVFILIAILGYMNSSIVGDIGFFTTNGLHDSIHLISGIVLLAVGLFAPHSASSTMKIFGIVYLLVAVLGLVGALAFLNINTADNWLHIVLGVVIYGLGRATAGSQSIPVRSDM